ncbi:hypothetical protein [Myxococcus xanthus]|uniref:hypothetical protein n=1 Tax=Myxococcus xanthus TaxID=34 RepID=UPI000477AF27|nr:hypothetical protein [Myxococcus xanthus]QVW70643.1 hypothetical protein JTM82_14285 [Myxococcus xanthus DZ2]QZZ49539.1 hypothetical protein MyxoNM_10020 [Myxococcus xanthus]UEO03230.1 hypothetical protein K1515_28530 [Myxococcus xanthus DZ2]UYI23974.1 hypothetical protein N1129_09915 [Myxococcus xanthus]SDY27709.1 hypothetical protein SAMN05444383_13013 [Myxococcus xanthus]
MKALTLRDLNKVDSLRFFFEGNFEPNNGLEREVSPLLDALEKGAVGWTPTFVKAIRKRKYSRDAVWRALEERRNEYGAIIGLYRTESPAVSLVLNLGPARGRFTLNASLEVQPLSFFADADACRGLVAMARAWASRYPAEHAAAHSVADRQLAGSPSFGRDDETWKRDGFDRVYELFWLNVFGPKLVDSVGRERMLSTPAHLVEELPNGSVLLVLWPTAAEFASEEARVVQARAHVHLRPDLDFDTVLSTLRERSAALVPVEPRFHPDVAPFLSRLPDEFVISERQRKIAELNAFRPPVPEEWLPVAHPSDVVNPERVLESYGDLSEGLVAALHTKVPSIMDETAESLTDLDFYFWRDNFPERYTRELIDSHTVPALGAYLGDVLVRRLGGTWVLRAKMEESQVRVGKRVWLPFLRARRYMQSRQALLDYSLTQYFHEAERYRP